jgi:DNA-binding transcriptional ArsR family regulator
MSLLDRRFAALSDPTRREILKRLGQGDATVTELRDVAPISQPALSRHLKVLEEAGLITARVNGSARPRSLNTDALSEVTRWLERLQARIERSNRQPDTVLEEMQAAPGDEDTDHRT